jgi:hypothetical protein
MKKEIVMKNTVKKILALVFVVAMVCSLAVPAFAADGDIKVRVTVIGRDGTILENRTEVTLSAKNQNIEKALKDEKVADNVDVSSSTGKVTAVNGLKATSPEVTGEFGTGAYVVALNGKPVYEDLATVAVAKDNEIVVYWADTTLGTKLVQYDASKIAQGVLAFYYYDAEGAKQPLTNATVEMNGLKDYTNVVGAAETAYVGETNAVNGLSAKNVYANYFTTDEKGQIWIAPADLVNEDASKVTLKITSVTVKELTAKGMGITDEDEKAYVEANANRNIEASAVEGRTIEVKNDKYNVAGATGDMTIVYALVAAAAVVTLGAVVVMKKKAKAN